MLPLSFSVDGNDESKTVGELKEEFYPLVRLLKKEVYTPYKNKRLARIQHPQRVILNPPGYGDPESVVHIDVYVAVYYRGYHVRIQHGNSMFGPHKFELLYQVCRGRRVWLGTWTAKFNFFSTRDLKKQLKLAILNEEYYCSPKSAEVRIEFEPEDDTPIIIDAPEPKRKKPRKLYMIGKYIVRAFYDV